MNDKELLESAARAAEISGSRDSDGGYVYQQRGRNEPGDVWVVKWNPLTDDGDALRLAVRLDLQVLIGQGPDGDITWVRAPDELDFDGPSEQHGADACAATRRAIVRAAAEIGREMG